MTEDQGRAEICEAGRALLEKGLVARTWGNVSVRLDESRFLVTPSGRSYETLAPAEIALVNLADLSWEGPFKPSAEKELHARVYRARPDVFAIIHTHQPAASAIAATRHGFVPPSDHGAAGDAGQAMDGGAAANAGAVGEEVPCVPYALPTTRSLARATETAVRGTTRRAFLLSNHGAICLADSLATSLDTAIALERASAAFVLDTFRRTSGEPQAGLSRMLDWYTSQLRGPRSAGADRTAGGVRMDSTMSDEFLMAGRNAARLIASKSSSGTGHGVVGGGESGDGSGEGAAVIATGPYAVAAAAAARTVKPMLDDLAQIVGPTLPYAATATQALRLLRRRSGVLVPGGCLCIGPDEAEARAVALVAEKGCRAHIESSILGGGHAISRIESIFMRRLYITSYSKRARG